MSMSNTIPARDFATKAHGNQQYGNQPYVVHLDAVVTILQEFGITDPQILAAGYLHDTLEDTKVTLPQLDAAFGYHPDGTTTEVGFIVDFCTDEPGPNRRTRKAATYKRIRATLDKLSAGACNNAISVKLADRLANIRQSVLNNGSLLDMYRRERETFRAALEVPAEHLTPPLRAMWDEYNRLLEPNCTEGPTSYLACGSCPARKHCAWVTKGPQP
jgi:(p)ppGpp synthase/HD superfamily hydrolase